MIFEIKHNAEDSIWNRFCYNTPQLSDKQLLLSVTIWLTWGVWNCLLNNFNNLFHFKGKLVILNPSTIINFK